MTEIKLFGNVLISDEEESDLVCQALSNNNVDYRTSSSLESLWENIIERPVNFLIIDIRLMNTSP